MLVLMPFYLVAQATWWLHAYVAITGSQLCVIRVPVSRSRLPRITIRAPLQSVRANVESKRWSGTQIRLDGPDFPPQGVLFRVSGWPWRDELDRVLAALPAGDSGAGDAEQRFTG